MCFQYLQVTFGHHLVIFPSLSVHGKNKSLSVLSCASSGAPRNSFQKMLRVQNVIFRHSELRSRFHLRFGEDTIECPFWMLMNDAKNLLRPRECQLPGGYMSLSPLSFVRESLSK